MGLSKLFKSPRLGVKLNIVLVLSFGILLIAILVVMSKSVTSLTARMGQHRAGQEAELIRSRFQETEQKVLADAKLLATTRGLVEAVASEDASRAKTLILIGTAPLDLDSADLVDAMGALMAAVEEGGTFDDDKRDALSSLALLGIETTAVIVQHEKESLKFQLVAVVPLRDRSGAIVGGLLAGRAIDDVSLAELNFSRDDIHLVLFYDGQIVAQHVTRSMKGPMAAAAEELAGILFDEAAIEQAMGGQIVIEHDLRHTTDGVPYALAYVPLEMSGDTRTAISILVNLSELLAFQSQLTTSMSVIFTLFALSAVAAAALFARRNIVVPIRQLTTVAKIVTRGELEVEARVQSDDEMGVLAGAFNQMISRLRGMLRGEQEQRERVERLMCSEQEQRENLQRILAQTRDAASNLSSAVTEILAAMTQQVAGADEQSAAISQTTTTVDEVKAIAGQSVVRAQEVADASQHTVEVSQAGYRAVQETIESMGQIKGRVEGIAENILALSEQTQQIGEIIATVNELASQSNMLALNAAVEAARAGEHGKGFAVVAAEVRNLAEQSKEATGQVRTILSDIQRATNATVMATEEGAKGVDEGIQLAARTREAIDRLSEVIDESARAAMQMVAGGQQQASGVEQIALAMQNIHQSTVQSLASTRQTEKAAQDLNELSRRLTETVDQYRL